MGGVEGQIAFVTEASLDAGANMTRRGGSNAAIRINGGGDAGVGGAKYPAVIFDGAHADHVEVLPWCTGVAIPAVVGDIDEYLRVIFHELADLVAEDGFVTDEDTIGVAIAMEDGAVGAAVHIAGPGGKLLREEEEVFEGNVLTPWNKVDLVIAAGA
jgi:hypothetical protein